MYEAFYGLKARPFLAAPDPQFLYWSESHTLGLSMLRFGLITRSPLSVITGEIGAGKTTLLRHLLNEMPEELEVGLISNMQAGRGELLHWVLMALGQSFGDEPYVQLFHRFQDYLVKQFSQGRRVILILDEAQNCDVRTLEELRMLTNTNSDQNDLIQIILVGQPQLRDLLSDPALVQFAQRISSDYHLGPLSEPDVGPYIRHRLEVAGGSADIFEESAFPLIFAASRGVPRLINTLCELLLCYGYSYDMRKINGGIVREIMSDVEARGVYRQFTRLSGETRPVTQLSVRAVPTPKSV